MLAAALLAHKIITAAQHAAAERFAEARARAFDDHASERRYDRMLARLTTSQQVAVTGLLAGGRGDPWVRRALAGWPLDAEQRRDKRDLLEELDKLAA